MGKIQLRDRKKEKKERKQRKVATKAETSVEVIPSECEGYKVLRLKSFQDSKAVHYALAKEHSVREKCPGKPEAKTIFVRGIPPFVNEEALKNAFGGFGKIKNVYFHSAPCASLPPVNTSNFFTDVPPVTGYKVAYIVFNKEDSARKAMLAPSENPLILYPEGPPSESFLDKVIDKYNRNSTTDITALKKEVDEYMLKHDAAEREEVLEKQKQVDEEADDGWITVTRKSGIPRKESVHKQIMKKQDNRVKKTQLLNFYRFQLRESKMNKLVQLREKFEEDKKKVFQLKETRKFKPF